MKLNNLIIDVIINDFSSIQILIGEDTHSLLSINGYFSVDIYNAADEELSLLNLLVNQENLFKKNKLKE